MEHEQIAIGDGAQARFPLRGWTENVAVEELTGLGVLQLVAPQDGPVGNGLRNVRLASTRFADDQCVAAFGDELQCMQLEARLRRQFGIGWRSA